MATPELRDLRAKYEAAYTAYQSCVQTLADASRKGEQPTAALLHSEARGFRDLSRLRQALTDDARAHNWSLISGRRPETTLRQGFRFS